MRPISSKSLFIALALGATFPAVQAAQAYQYRQAVPGMSAAQVAQQAAPVEAPKAYATLDPTRKSGTGTLTNNTISGGSGFFVQSTLAQSAFYFEGHVISYYAAVGLGSPTLALLFDSGGGVWLNASRRFTWTRQPTNNDNIAWSWDGSVASLYINGQKVYTTSPGDLPAGAQRALLYSNGGTADANFGATPFAYSVPAGLPAGLYQ